MALFRPRIQTQRALLTRVFTVAVNAVDFQSHYTSPFIYKNRDETSEQAKNLPKTARKNELTIFTDYNASKVQKFPLAEGAKKYYLVKTHPKSSLLLDKTPLACSLATPSQLALISLNYGQNWQRHIALSYTVNKEKNSRNKVEKCEVVFHPGSNLGAKQRVAKSPSIKRIENCKSHQDLDSDIVLFTNHCNQVTKPNDSNKKDFLDKCDPLSLATVYQALRDELPVFFEKGHGYQLYDKNVKFINGLSNTTFRGLKTYKCIMTSMRVATQMCLSDLRMDILKITKDTNDCSIKVRWRVSGMPRYTSIIGFPKTVDYCRYIDGFSVFEVNAKGLIQCHRLLKLMPSQTPEKTKPKWNPLMPLNSAHMMSLLQKPKRFLFARHPVLDIKEACQTSIKSENILVWL